MDEIGTRAPGVTTIPADQATKSRSAAVQALAAITGAAAGAAALLGLAGTAHPVSFTTVRGGAADLFGAGRSRC
jgi:hypothetical protein